MSRELDAKVAMQLGWQLSTVSNYPWQMVPPDENIDGSVKCVSHYSTDIAAAWELLSILRKDGWKISMEDEGDNYFSVWARKNPCPVCQRDDGDVTISQFVKGFESYPEAICRVFLEAFSE